MQESENTKLVGKDRQAGTQDMISFYMWHGKFMTLERQAIEICAIKLVSGAMQKIGFRDTTPRGRGQRGELEEVSRRMRI